MTTPNSNKLGFKPENHWQAKAIMRNRAGQPHPLHLPERKLAYQIAHDLIAYNGSNPQDLYVEIEQLKQAAAIGFKTLKKPAKHRSDLFCTLDRITKAAVELMLTVPK